MIARLLNKRNRYVIHSLLIFFILYYYQILYPQKHSINVFVIMTLLVLIGSYLVHLPNSKIGNILISSILPLMLITGIELTMMYFPNLSPNFKLLMLAIFSIVFYIVSLVNNIFLVVESREEMIPLYRVGLTWSKIVIALIAIPVLAGIAKISVNPLYQALFMCIVAFLFFIYLLWSLRFNKEVKKYRAGEIITVFSFGLYLMLFGSLAVSFFPTEAFLRGIFVSSILIFLVSFIEDHLKNSLNTKIITEHIIIILLFLFLLFIFN